MKLRAINHSEMIIWAETQAEKRDKLLMTPLKKKKGFNQNKVLPLLSSSPSPKRNQSPDSTGIFKSSSLKRKSQSSSKKIVFSDKKVTTFAGVKIVVGKNDEVDVIQE